MYSTHCIHWERPDETKAELEAYLKDENLDLSTAVRKLLAEGLDEWRRALALDQLASGTITQNVDEDEYV